MIGGIVGRILDVNAAKEEAQDWERQYHQLLQEHAKALGQIKRLKKDIAEKNAQLADYRASADGDTRKIAADNSYLRLEKAKLTEQARLVVEVAAVTVAWIESIDRRNRGGEAAREAPPNDLSGESS